MGQVSLLELPGLRTRLSVDDPEDDPEGVDGGQEGADKGWRLAFIAGLIVAPLLSGLAGYPLPMPQMPDSWATIVIAGLLVGFGARLGGGCTSGHGVCGVARAARSLSATAIFMATAIAVVAVMRHGLGA